MQRSRRTAIYILLFVLANILYLPLVFSDVFCYDEAYTVGMINRSFSEIIEVTSQDVHSPFYYIMLKIFCYIPFIDKLILTRIFSWIFMLLFFFAGSKICRKVYDEKVQCCWALLSLFMPIMLIQTANARMYTMGLFFFTVSSYLAYSIYKSETRKKWILFTLSTIVTIYIHTFCMIEMVVVCAIFIIVCLSKKRMKTALHMVYSGLIISLSYVPWLLILYHQFLRWMGKETGWGNTIPSITVDSLYGYIKEWFSSYENPNIYVIVFSIILVAIASYYAVKYVIQTKDYLPCLSLLAAGITFVAAMLISIFVVPCFLGRYLFPLFGGIWIFIAVGLSKINMKPLKYALIAGIFLCSIATFRDELELRDRSGLEEYLAYMDENLEDDDVIMADTYFSLMLSIYYPENDYMIYGAMPKCIPFKNLSIFTDWAQLQEVDTVWYLSMENFQVGHLNDKYTISDTKKIDYSYYTIVVDQYTLK